MSPPYDPSRTPIRQLVLEDIEATLQAIAPPTFASTMADGQVRRYGVGRVTVSDYPGCVVVPLEETTDDRRTLLQEHLMTVALQFVVRSASWRDALLALLADARVALLTDHTRGGNAAWTRITAEEVFDADASTPIASAQMTVQVLYRTAYDDPTTPL